MIFLRKFVLFLIVLNGYQCLSHFVININAFSIKSIKTANSINSEAHDDYKEDPNSEPHSTNLLRKCNTCPDTVGCVPQIQCPAHVRMNEKDKPQICDLIEGNFGFCCKTGQNHTASQDLHARVFSHPTFVPMSVIEEARLKFVNLMHQIPVMPVKRGGPDFLHGITFHSSPQDDLQSFQLANIAMEQIITSQIFSKKEQIPLDDIITNNINVDFEETPPAQHCSQPKSCNKLKVKYRSFDGSCNNPHHTHWGTAGQPMERLLPPAYEDGIWTPRTYGSVDGTLLPGAREISRRIILDINRPHPKYNLLMMQFGQFIAHDVTQSSSIRLEGGELIECCNPNGESVLPPEKRHFACFPIAIEPDDEFFRAFNVRCMNFVRLSLAPICKMHYGKQRSKVTHFLDGSAIYSSSLESARQLRTFRQGKLRMFRDFGRDLLPLTNDKRACESEEPGKLCFKSGDGRTNQIISLIVLHTVFAREHNRIAEILSQINPHYSDERIFQEARRIVIAELQHITYNEYLPSVIGPMQMRRFRLLPQRRGYANDYDHNVNPAVTNEFSGAAFRMGHSSVDGKFRIHKNNNSVDEIINIPDTMFNPTRIRHVEFYDNMLLSLITQPMQKVDSFLTYGLSRFMFRGHHPFGLDLAAFNIQRGRDQGLRPYNDYLELIGHKKIRSFDQLGPDVGFRLAQVYKSPDDIDLWVGGLQEKPVDGSIVGITFSEIIADQFSRFKHGDRYYYEYYGDINPGAFTIDQLHEIRKVTIARLICDNADHSAIREIPPAAFVRADFPGNAAVDCDRIPAIDMKVFRS